MLSMSLGLRVLKSELEIGTPSRMNRGALPELMELVPRIWKEAALLGSPEEAMTCRPVLCPCSAWSKLAAGTFSIFSAFTADTEPAIVPFFLTPYATTTTSSTTLDSGSSVTFRVFVSALTGSFFVTMPMYETTSVAFEAPLTSMVKLPSTSVATPFVVPS